MNVNSSSSVSTQQNSSSAKQTVPPNTLGKDAFMKILVTQIRNQDPLEPLKDTEFIAQMAQFSSLEQLTNLNTAMTQFIGLQENKPLIENADLIGNTIYWEQEIDGEMQTGEGIVKALSLKNGELMVELQNEEKSVSIGFIHRIEKDSKTEN